MKTLILSVIVMSCYAGTLLASDESSKAESTNKPKELDSLVTNSGKTYTKVIIREVTPSGIKIFHEAGAATINYEDIPKDIQEVLGGFDAATARQHREQENQRLRAQERAIGQQLAEARQQEHAKERQAALDSAKMPTRIRVKQMNEGGALCEVSIKIKKKFYKRIPRPLGGYDVIEEEKWVWTGYSNEWYFVSGLPGHLVDGSVWEGWTLPSGSYAYTNTLGARKTVRKLEVVSGSKK